MNIIAAAPDSSPLLALIFFLGIPIALIWWGIESAVKRRRSRELSERFAAAERDRQVKIANEAAAGSWWLDKDGKPYRRAK